jgi:excisionase family DNA binding protein
MRKKKKHKNLKNTTDPTTVPVLADVLGYAHATSVNRAIRDGRLKAKRVGGVYLVSHEDVERALEEDRIRPRTPRKRRKKKR